MRQRELGEGRAGKPRAGMKLELRSTFSDTPVHVYLHTTPPPISVAHPPRGGFFRIWRVSESSQEACLI